MTVARTDETDALLRVVDVSKSFPGRARQHRVAVLDQVNMTVARGGAQGLVGESGSGKTTLLRCILGLTKPDAGQILYEHTDLVQASPSDWRRIRREVQLVPQDPYASLNPRMTVEELVEEGLVVHRMEPSAARRRDRVVEILAGVGIGSDSLEKYPRAMSGGQRQRVAIARALAVSPRLLVCDEPVSALDVSIQAQVLNLLQDLRQTFNLSLLFISHDLAVVNYLCENVAVMSKGRIVEAGSRHDVFNRPRHSYTRDLIAAVRSPAEHHGLNAVR